MSFIFKGLKNLFGGGDIEMPEPPPPPPTTPTRADSSIITGRAADANIGLKSLINTSGKGLTRKANTTKRSLLGGS